MSRGAKPTTRRSPAQGGREVHVRLSAEEYQRVKAAADGYGMTVPAYVRGMVLGARYRDLLPAVMAEVKAVELDRPLPVAEVVGERSCWNCAHSRVRKSSVSDTTSCALRSGTLDYRIDSGAESSPDGLPTDRALKCPGWARKEPT